jgi:hypothetical protein
LSYPDLGKKGWLEGVFQPIISGKLYLDVNTGHVLDVQEVFLNPTVREVPWRKLGGQWDEVAHGVGARLARFGLDRLVNFGVDAAWQIGADWSRYDIPLHHKAYRAGIAGGTGVFFGGLTTFGLSAIGVTAWWVASVHGCRVLSHFLWNSCKARIC